MIVKDRVSYAKEKFVLSKIVSERDNSVVYVVYDSDMTSPTNLAGDEVEIIDNFEPTGWRTVQRNGQRIWSFPEWTNDEYFYNYLLEEEWKPDKTVWAETICAKRFKDAVANWLVEVFGSIENAKEKYIEYKKSEQNVLTQNRGYEQKVYNKSELEKMWKEAKVEELLRVIKAASSPAR